MNKNYKIKLSFFTEINNYFIIIKNDYYKIAERIKKIDRTLCLVYNVLHKQFEVHDLRTIDNTFVLAFDELDKEILSILNKAKDRDTIEFTRSETRKRIRYSEQKQRSRSSENKDFINRTQLEIISR